MSDNDFDTSQPEEKDRLTLLSVVLSIVIIAFLFLKGCPAHFSVPMAFLLLGGIFFAFGIDLCICNYSWHKATAFHYLITSAMVSCLALFIAPLAHLFLGPVIDARYLYLAAGVFAFLFFLLATLDDKFFSKPAEDWEKSRAELRAKHQGEVSNNCRKSILEDGASPRINALLELNKRYSPLFAEYDSDLSFPLLFLSFPLNSEHAFKHFDPEIAAARRISEDIRYYEEAIEKADACSRLARDYRDALRDLPSSSNSDKSFLKMEQRLFDQMRIEVSSYNQPCNLYVSWSYSSPSGKKELSNGLMFNAKETRRLVRYARDVRDVAAESRRHSERERSRITPALRYDIMARDGFRCVRCGASPSDGVTKLHVDHIVPVSKGGLSEMDNLQTLCSKCNLGKGNRYSE